MATRLKIKHKLLLVWFGSVLFSLALFAILIVTHVSELHEETSRRDIFQAFSVLRTRVEALRTDLERSALLLSGRKDIIASINMIDTYQDVTNYNPLIFDLEKKALAEAISRQARAAHIEAAAVFDGDAEPAAFYFAEPNGRDHYGLVTFKGGKPTHVFLNAGAESAVEAETHPSILSDAIVAAVKDGTAGHSFRGTRHGPALLYSAPILRRFPNGEQKTVGTLTLAGRLDDAFVREMETRTGMSFAISIPGGDPIGTPGLATDLKDAAALPPLLDTAAATTEPALLRHPHFFLGAMSVPLADGTRATFLFGSDKAHLLASLSGLRMASLMTLLIAGAVLLPAGIFVLNRTISRRVERLVAGVQAFEKGAWERMVEADAGDELGTLAKAFDKMAETIRSRETDLWRSQARLANAQRLAHLGNWNHDLRTSAIWWSDETYRIFGLEPTAFEPAMETVGPFIQDDDRDAFTTLLGEAARFGGPYAIDLRIQRADGIQRVLHLQGETELDETGKPKRLSGTVQDVTDQRTAEENLRNTIELLTQSNTQLERFAFLASHDLQEPLRNVVSYAQIIEKRYAGKLDPEADEYIGYVVGGAKRMRALIQDILAYSKVSAKGKPFTATDLSQSVETALANLHETIEESRARISVGDLPVIRGDSIQLTELFQNLINNALKFVQPGDIPEIQIESARMENGWEITVADNGIGIEPQYLERIFAIFKRLHTSETYPGTGIGLAICKQIVERHGGRIWATSSPGERTAFHVVLPAAAEPEAVQPDA